MINFITMNLKTWMRWMDSLKNRTYENRLKKMTRKPKGSYNH